MSGKYEILFSDIDGTLLNDQHQVTEKTRAEIQRVVHLGIPFVLVSSRMPGAITSIQKMAGIAGPMICYGGGLILDESGNVAHSEGIAPHVAAAVGRLVEKEFCRVSWNIHAYDRWQCASPKSKWVEREEEIIGIRADSGKLEEILDWGLVHKVLCIGEPGDISALQERMRPLFPSLNICTSSPCYLEISGAGVSKGRAIGILCDRRNIPIERSMAFGDNYNDLDMLEKAGTAYLMKNAPEELKGRFPNVTESNNEDGIALVLQREIV